jgi:hypothetical protein
MMEINCGFLLSVTSVLNIFRFNNNNNNNNKAEEGILGKNEISFRYRIKCKE